MGPDKKKVSGEKVTLDDVGVTVNGIPYNGFNEFRYIVQVEYKGDKWLRAQVVRMGESNYSMNDTDSMSLITKSNFKQDFIDTLEDKEAWIKTSYNTLGGRHYDLETGLEDSLEALRYNYAGIGYAYDAVADAFIPPKPFTSWLLNEESCQWIPPVAYPNDGKIYQWDEATIAWVES